MTGPNSRTLAISMLARREHSQAEITAKLTAREFSADEIGRLLIELQREGLQSDQRFAESFVRSKAQKGLGPIRLRQELRQHDIADQVISDYLADYDWFELAVKARQKRFGLEPPADYQLRAKQMRFLQYRGFDHQQISEAMKQNEWEAGN